MPTIGEIIAMDRHGLLLLGHEVGHGQAKFNYIMMFWRGRRDSKPANYHYRKGLLSTGW
jgi:hypothetical protein